ncbi:hypothetical protein [Saccharospirillum impatiens]|uniref:hypothetical protein n=1 Tax=Saccharospirillum impatiens TaxID=169438 RepID=UPI0012FCBA7C|nr:hypothetical protein [Saccharospirillum impatiens]
MSKVYQQINSVTGVAGVSFGGGGGGGSRKKKKKKSNTSHLDRVETQIKLGGGVSQVDKAYPYSSYNVSHNNGTRTQDDGNNADKKPGQRLFSQFNSDIPGGHADRNTGRIQAETLKNGWNNSSRSDKVIMATSTLSHTNPVGILYTSAQVAAKATDK